MIIYSIIAFISFFFFIYALSRTNIASFELVIFCTVFAVFWPLTYVYIVVRLARSK